MFHHSCKISHFERAFGTVHVIVLLIGDVYSFKPMSKNFIIETTLV